MPAMCIALALAIVVVAAIAIVKNSMCESCCWSPVWPLTFWLWPLVRKTFFQKELNPLVWFSLTF